MEYTIFLLILIIGVTSVNTTFAMEEFGNPFRFRHLTIVGFNILSIC